MVVEYVLNVIENGELSDVIEGADDIRDYIKDKEDSEEKTDVCVAYNVDDEYD
jgi:hypothetical protein